MKLKTIITTTYELAFNGLTSWVLSYYVISGILGADPSAYKSLVVSVCVTLFAYFRRKIWTATILKELKS